MPLINGTSGDDTLIGTELSDAIYGFGGNDSIEGGNFGDFVFGMDGDDALHGQDGNDLVYGGTGNDFVTGGEGSDILYGGEGNNSIFAGAGDGDKSDFAFGNEGNDLIGVGAGDDFAYGGEGRDTIFGGAGDDFLFNGEDGDAPEDTSDGGTIWSGTGNDTAYGDDGDDVIGGGVGGDVVSSFDGDNSLFGADGSDILSAGAGDDTVFGGIGTDIIFGDADFNPLTNPLFSETASGDDLLYGGDAQELSMAARRRHPVGGTGNDFLTGGTLFGGPDGEQDIFVFAPGDGLDTVRDWEDTAVAFDGLDLIDLSAFGLASIAFVTVVQNGANVEITIVGVDPADFMITLANATAADLGERRHPDLVSASRDKTFYQGGYGPLDSFGDGQPPDLDNRRARLLGSNSASGRCVDRGHAFCPSLYFGHSKLPDSPCFPQGRAGEITDPVPLCRPKTSRYSAGH